MTLFQRARVWLVLAVCAWLAGCAAPVQQPVDLAPGFFSAAKAKTGRIGVVMAQLPQPNTQFPGAGCLLCIGVAELAHNKLTAEVKTFSTEELKPLPGELAALLKQQGLDAVLINDPLVVADLPDLGASDPTNKARKNFGTFKTKHNVDRLLVIDLTSLGVWRSYSAYVPADLPRAVLNGNASLIDLSNHALEWYLPLVLSRAADGNWDEPPKFPGLSNAYYQVLETGKDMVKKPFNAK